MASVRGSRNGRQPRAGPPAIPDVFAEQVGTCRHDRVARIALPDLLLDEDASWIAARSRMAAGERTGGGAGFSSLAATSLRYVIMLARNSSGLSVLQKADKMA